MNDNTQKVIVIIPAFNEEKTIREVLHKMPDLISQGVRIISVVIDDGSRDRTAEYALASGAEIISHGTNMGLGKSFQDGLQYSLEQDADIMVNIDADLQYDPADITNLIQPILENKADFVTADRFSGDDDRPAHRPAEMPRVKYWGNQRMTHLVNSLASTQLGDVSSGFRAISREAILNLNLTGKYTYTHEMILDLAFKHLRLLSVPVKVTYYSERESKVASNLFHYTNQTLRIILRAFRDYKPFYFFSLLAAAPAVIGTAMLLFMLIHFIMTGDFSPYKFIGFTGIYLASLAILLVIIGFLADILVSLRLTAEKQLYLQKKMLQRKDSRFE